MTEQEAKEYMENEIRCIQKASYCDHDCAKCELVKEEEPLLEAFGMAIKALEEIQQYRAIGLTPAMVQDLIKSCKKHEKNALENAHIVDDYREIGTVEEFKALKENEPKCEDCAGCTNWLCDCANIRANAIDEFAEQMKELVYKWIDKGFIAVGCIDKIAEQMKGGE